MTDEPALFPTFLKLAGRRVVVVGGWTVAAGKVTPLVEVGARVTVVAPEVCPAIRSQDVELIERPFRQEDLDEAWFAIAAAPPDVNRAVSEAAATRRVFVNAVDDPRHATAYAGGVLRRSGVTIAVSTTGRAPALAGLLREGVEAILPADLDAWVDVAERLRTEWRAGRTPMHERRPLLLDALCRLYDERRQVPAASPGMTESV